MSLFLDSAQPDEVRTAMQWGWVAGVTTNPTLLAKSGLPPAETLETLARTASGMVFYQLTAPTVEGMLEEAQRAGDILQDHLALKIMPTPPGFEVAAQLSDNIPCAITGVYSAAQAMVAQAAGAAYVIFYYHRALGLLEDVRRFLRELTGVLADTKTELIAASVKSVEEAVEVRMAGVQHLTLPFSILQALMEHDLSARTLEEFNREGRGLFAP